MDPSKDADILEGIRAVAKQHLEYEGPLTPDTSLVQAMALDSIRMLTLVVELENHFGICLEEGDEDGVETVDDLLGVLRSRLA